MGKFTAIRDTREKPAHGWIFYEDSACAGTSIYKLDTGDYSIEGLEETFCIERKQTISEFVNNCNQKRWAACVERMGKMDSAHILFEFPEHHVEEWPKWALDNAAKELDKMGVDQTWDPLRYNNYMFQVKRRVYRTRNVGRGQVEITHTPRVTPKFIRKRLHEAEDLGISIWFAENSKEANEKAYELMKQAYDTYVRC